MIKPIISVIIPVWNAEQYLRRCIDSVTNQTLSNIEIICVNDSSIDGSRDILESYKHIDDRIRIINMRHNSGESAARNAGIALARGEYIGSVDNDDKIDLDFYEKLYAKVKKTDADIIKGTRMHYALNKKPQEHNINKYIGKNKTCFTSQWWTAIYKNKFIKDNKIDFPVGFPLNGDAVFLTKAVICANKVITRNDTFYHYYRRNNSGNPIIMSTDKMLSFIETTKIILNYINKKEDLLQKNEYDYLYYIHLQRIIRAVLRNTTWKNQEIPIKRVAAETVHSYFEKCKRKNILEHFFSSRLPDIYKALAERNKEALVKILLSDVSIHTLNAQMLRARLSRPSFTSEYWDLTQ